MAGADIVTDYLVVGGGISGLSFVDELLTSTTNATITIIDRRDVPGGHWNDAYPFVKLHQPATFYGVESKELTNHRIDEDGPNKGFLNLASGPEITSYCHAVVRDRFLPSGRVTFLPLTEYQPDGSLRALLSDRRLTVDIKKRLVDASYYTNKIPKTHARPFTTEAAVNCIPPNDLPRLASDFSNYTVLGGGKTGIDSCMWLLSNGAPPNRIQWVIPNDYWYVDRAKTQNGPEFFLDVMGTFIELRYHIGQATDARDLALRHEQCGMWHRLDPDIEPKSYHAATVSKGEIAELRKIKNIVRKGRVTRIGQEQMFLTKGAVHAIPDVLYIDCTASAIPQVPLQPIFQPGKIVLQMIRYPQIPFSAALVAFTESLPVSDAEKNGLLSPVPFEDSVQNYLRGLWADFQNRAAIGRYPAVRQWISRSRLEGFAALAANVKPEDTDTLALLAQVKDASAAAGANLPRLIAGIEGKAKL